MWRRASLLLAWRRSVLRTILLITVLTTTAVEAESTAASPSSYPRAPRAEDLVDVAGTDHCRHYAAEKITTSDGSGDNIACNVNYVFMARNCARTCAQIRTTLKIAAGAASIIIEDDLADLEFCFKWTEAGHCTSNAPWMFEHCATTCTYILNIGCPRWAQRNDCVTNPKFMHTVCHAACAAAQPQNPAAGITTATKTTTDDQKDHRDDDNTTYEEYSSINAAAAATAATASEEYVSTNTIHAKANADPVLELTPDLYKQLQYRNSAMATPASAAAAVAVCDTAADPATVQAQQDQRLQSRSRFYVKFETRSCAHKLSCALFQDEVWTHLATQYPEEIFTTVNCEHSPLLCHEMTSWKYINGIRLYRGFHVVVVEFMDEVVEDYSDGHDGDDHLDEHRTMTTTTTTKKKLRRRRAVETYAGDNNFDMLIDLFTEMIQRNEPLLPYLFNNHNQKQQQQQQQQQQQYSSVSRQSDGNDNNSNTNNSNTNNNGNKTPVSNQQQPKQRLAILVLATDGFVRPDIWTAFMESSRTDDSTVEIEMFVHNKPTTKKNPDTTTTTNTNIPEFCHVVPTVHTQWGTVSLIRAPIQLLQAATAYATFDQYILVSGDSIPLLDAPTVMHKLMIKTTRRTTTKEDATTKNHPERNSSRAISHSLFEQHIKHESEPSYVFRYGANIGNTKIGYGSAAVFEPITFQPQQQPPKTTTTTTTIQEPYGYQRIIKSKLWFCMNHNDAHYYAHPNNDESYNFELTLTPDEYYFATLSHEYYEEEEEDESHPTTTPHQDTMKENSDTIPDPYRTMKVGTPGVFVQDQPVMHDAWTPTDPHTGWGETVPLSSIDDYLHLQQQPQHPGTSTTGIGGGGGGGPLFARKITATTTIDLLWIKRHHQQQQQQR